MSDEREQAKVAQNKKQEHAEQVTLLENIRKLFNEELVPQKRILEPQKTISSVEKLFTQIQELGNDIRAIKPKVENGKNRQLGGFTRSKR